MIDTLPKFWQLKDTLKPHRSNGCKAAKPSVEAQLRSLMDGLFLTWEQVGNHFADAPEKPTYGQYQEIALRYTPVREVDSMQEVV